MLNQALANQYKSLFGNKEALAKFLQYLYPNTVNPNTVNPNTAYPNTVNPNTVNPNTSQITIPTELATYLMQSKPDRPKPTAPATPPRVALNNSGGGSSIGAGGGSFTTAGDTTVPTLPEQVTPTDGMADTEAQHGWLTPHERVMSRYVNDPYWGLDQATLDKYSYLKRQPELNQPPAFSPSDVATAMNNKYLEPEVKQRITNAYKMSRMLDIFKQAIARFKVNPTDNYSPDATYRDTDNAGRSMLDNAASPYGGRPPNSLFSPLYNHPEYIFNNRERSLV